MSEPVDYIGHMNESIQSLLKDALRISLRHPSMALYILRTMLRQRKAARRRARWDGCGIHVPPFLIASITSRCNLHCKGCFARAHQRPIASEMTLDRWLAILDEARDLGVSFILLAGGEPLLRRDILDATRRFPEIVFPVFTNGLLLDDALIAQFREQKNVIPVMSLEGYSEETDGRRGVGVYDQLKRLISRMNGGLFFGVSLTVTRLNFETVTGEEFIKGLLEAGCSLFFFVEYVPVKEGTEDWVPTPEQRARLLGLVHSFRSRLPGLFIAFPGDEAEMGGCLAAGRGFAHISPEGDLEPCPFAPYSDTSLTGARLREGLQSGLLRTIRDNHEMLSETGGGCALWQNRDWLRSLAGSSAGHRGAGAEKP